MDENWIKVYSTSLPWQAEMAKQVLEENGIEAVVINQQDSNFFFGEATVYVENEWEETAKELLKGIGS
jgi:hypothetical protein